MVGEDARMRADWVVYGSSPWAGTWYTEHNLAHALAAEDRVLFVDPPMSPLTPLRSRGTRFGQLAARRPRRMGRLLSFRPVVAPPIEAAIAQRASSRLLAMQVRRAVRRARLHQPVVLAARWRPGLAGAAGEVARLALLQDWVPAGAALLGRSAHALELELESLCEAGDRTVVTSEALRRELVRRGRDATVIRHGFPADLVAGFEHAKVPAEIAALPRPRLGYTGGIDARLDFGALGALADRFPTGSVVLVGPVSPRLDGGALGSLLGRPNVHLLGARDRAEIPGCLVGMDCLLMPYVEDEWGRYGSPLKLWEYLYAGPPLAGSGYRVLAEHPPPEVHFASPPGRLGDAVQAALAEPGAARAERRRLALANTWDDRAARLVALAERLLAGTPGRHP